MAMPPPVRSIMVQVRDEGWSQKSRIRPNSWDTADAKPTYDINSELVYVTNYIFSSKTNTNNVVCLFQNSFFDQFIWIKSWKYCFDSIIKTPPFLITHGRQVLLIKYYYLTVSNRVWHFSFNFATFNVKNEFDISESIFKTKINLFFVLELSCPFTYL